MGMDCIGVLRATALVVDYGPTKTFVRPPYRVNPDPVQFVGLLRENFDEILVQQIKPGDIFCMDYGEGIQHVGIFAGGGKIIHSERRFDRVAEHDIDDEWWSKMLKAGIAFKWRDVEA